jgi:hypothetical protein
VISSGVQMQAQKDQRGLDQPPDRFIQAKIKDPQRKVEVIDAMQEARLPHLASYLIQDASVFFDRYRQW